MAIKGYIFHLSNWTLCSNILYEHTLILNNKVEKQEEILNVLSDLARETERQEKRLAILESDFESEYRPSIDIIFYCT